MSDSQACAAAIVAQLVAQGVREFVASPGSRSAGLTLAALSAEGMEHVWQVADQAIPVGRTRAHMRSDERTAGFLALGLAKQGQPSVVITTSGTAAGNLLPAVMEAWHSQLPLIVVTADRPSHQVGFGVNQTADQQGLFKGFTRWAAEVDCRAPRQSWFAQAARAFLAASGLLGEPPGPVHLNVRLAPPLTVAGPVPLPEARPVAAERPAEAEPVMLPGGRKTIVVAGDQADAQAALRLAEEARVPLIAEPSSNARRGPNALGCGRIVLRSALAQEIERVVVYGRPNCSREVAELLAREDVEIVSVGSRRADPGQRASRFVGGVTMLPEDQTWLSRWKGANDKVSAALAEILTASESPITGPGLARRLMANLEEGDILYLGASNPVRDADLAPVKDWNTRWWHASTGTILANRGLSGIDGAVSSAIGAALRNPAARNTLYCGDLTFLHDANGLAVPPGSDVPDLRIVVADDHGGSIFATLEYGAPEYGGQFERAFAVPAPTDLVALAQSHGVRASRVSTMPDLDRALASRLRGVDVVVVDVDRRGRKALAQQVAALARVV
ncbi:MAG: 2-succinyl-5-enolpyruvyl-6-hydroxy-3-cyclohexene-1-carboxylic-acid synthase [Propionibacteriaceae bacterium]|nr:2-succinyl-5-enolpyruvyl-6-hydroxy-3-cyclohexene-1-carboxylic-acid synthase [Propionibacteriaceae bacterium]